MCDIYDFVCKLGPTFKLPDISFPYDGRNDTLKDLFQSYTIKLVIFAHVIFRASVICDFFACF